MRDSSHRFVEIRGPTVARHAPDMPERWERRLVGREVARGDDAARSQARRKRRRRRPSDVCERDLAGGGCIGQSVCETYVNGNPICRSVEASRLDCVGIGVERHNRRETQFGCDDREHA